MTVATSNFPFKFTLDGSTHEFPFASKILSDADLIVILREIATGTETVLTRGTQYEVTGENGKYESGGVVNTIEYVDGTKTDKDYADTYELIIDRAVAVEQPTVYKKGRALDLSVIGDSFDKLTMILQDYIATAIRGLLLPVGEANLTLPLAANRALKYLFFDSDGNPTAAAGAVSDEITVSAFMENVVAAASASAARTLLEVVYASIAQAKAGVLTNVVISPATLAAVLQSGSMNVAAAAGTDAYTATLVPAISDYEGGIYIFSFTNANTITNPTIALNGLAVKTIKRANGDALTVGDIAAGGVHLFMYNGGYFYLVNPSEVITKGDANLALIMDGTGAALLWGASLQSILTTKGDMVYASDANTPARLAKGAVGQYCRMATADSQGWGAPSFFQVARTERTETGATSYIKKKEILCPVAGVYEVGFEMLSASGGYARIYRDGVAAGTERRGTADYVLYLEKITVTAGQKLQLYVNRTVVVANVTVKDFTVRLTDTDMTVLTD